MALYLGIDIGTVSVKIAVIGAEQDRSLLEEAASSSPLFLNPARLDFLSEAPPVLVTNYMRIRGNPTDTTLSVLEALNKIIPQEKISSVRICGSGSGLVSKILNVPAENEFRAIARGVAEFYGNFSTIFEMGGQNAKFLQLEKSMGNSSSGLKDYEKSGDCAAGTGSFLDQQAFRLRYRIEDIGKIVESTKRSAKIAGRCSVFAKSDMIHAQQKGYQPAEVLKGLCEAVARNYKSSILKGKKITKPVLFIGGVAINTGVARAMREVFQLKEDELVVPVYYAWLGALGAAVAARDNPKTDSISYLHRLKTASLEDKSRFPVGEPLSMEKVVLLRDRARNRSLSRESQMVNAYMGLDIGSVSTNVVLLDDQGTMIKEIYTRTEGRPIEVVQRCLDEIVTEVGDRIVIKGVGTTGSGRELIGELVGADTVNDEITAHKTGAEFLARHMLDTSPDTIFEIGGQDSKYISLEKGVVVDFAMNEACAAGTGSFLEERAEELGISIKEEFARLAFASEAPIKLGERCTVFMEQDVAAYQQRGASREDLTAGLAYSIVYNYLNRVVRGRKIGDVIFFQGGTAYNDAIASAFARVLDKEIIVPPYNGVIGAVGAALLARDKMISTGHPSRFRGFELDKVNYTLREFTCKACSNFCQMQEFTVEGEKTYWGDQCSDKFRRRRNDYKKPVIEDLISLRKQIFFEDYDEEREGKAIIGLPRGLYIYEQFPFWNTFFRSLGYRVVLSDETNGRIIKSGVENCVAQPCLPIQAYHGHVDNLLNRGVDWLFIPNTINSTTPFPEVNSYYCPWGQTVPFVVRSAPAFEQYQSRMLIPSLRFRDGKIGVLKALESALKPLAEKRSAINEALDVAYNRQREVEKLIHNAGKVALKTLKQTGDIGIVLVGRTYNIHDRGMTLDIGNKLRNYYGVNVIPMDFLPVDEVDVSDINANMYWNYGRKILAAAKIVGQYPNLHIIYMTNFKCGPDSYIKHYITEASGKPFLSLQFDGHSNDAGYITRCEAYLDSKGVLRNWEKNQNNREYIHAG